MLLRRREEMAAREAENPPTQPPPRLSSRSESKNGRPPRYLLLTAHEPTPEPFICAICGQVLPYVADNGRRDTVLPHSFSRERCLCELREDEQQDAEIAKRRAEEAEAERRRYIMEIKRESGIDPVPAILNLRFDTFDMSRSKSMAKAADSLKAWAEGFVADETVRGFTLSSARFGCGKTHLAYATARVLLDRGIPTFITTMGELLASMREEFQSGHVGSRLKKASGVRVLIIDDFGTERIAPGEKGDWVREQIYTLFDKRSRYNRPVIVTTNLDLSEIENRIGGDHGGRVASRLMQLAEWLDVDGPDGRLTR